MSEFDEKDLEQETGSTEIEEKKESSGEFDPNDAGEVEEKQVKDYDFARPSKFSKEHLRTQLYRQFRPKAARRHE